MMCAERTKLDKAKSLLLNLLLGSSFLKSQCGPCLVFKTPNSAQPHVCVYGVCACLAEYTRARMSFYFYF